MMDKFFRVYTKMIKRILDFLNERFSLGDVGLLKIATCIKKQENVKYQWSKYGYTKQ
jgi:hypothetical protein